MLRKLKEIYLSNKFLRFFIFSILVTLFVALFKYVVFANEISVTEIPFPSVTINDESNISSSNPTGERSSTVNPGSYGFKSFKSNADIKVTNFLFKCDYSDNGKSYRIFQTVMLISATGNAKVLDNNDRNNTGDNFYSFNGLINPSGVNFNGNTKVKKTSNVAYYVTFHNPSTFQDDIRKYLTHYAQTGEFSEATIDISNSAWNENGEPTANVTYDLEMPLNVTCKFHNKTFGNSYYNITWEQSDGLDIQGWETEIYISQHIKYGKYLWSLATSPHYYDTKYYLVDTVSTFLGKYKKIWKSDVFYQGTKDELYAYVEKEKGYTPQITSVRKNNFMLRNKFVDKDGKTHYSDYVYLKEGEDGNYTASVIKAEETDKNGGITDIKYGEEDTKVDTNNDTYKNSDVSSSTTSFSGGVSTLKSLFSDLQELPKLIEEMFSFIPGQFIFALTAMLIVLIPIAILKLIK